MWRPGWPSRLGWGGGYLVGHRQNSRTAIVGALLDREHYRVRFVANATRAGELLLARREGERAEALARRALDVDPWSESAYAILVGSALARGDRSGARRMLERCLAALADLGAQPSDTACQLERRVQEPSA